MNEALGRSEVIDLCDIQRIIPPISHLGPRSYGSTAPMGSPVGHRAQACPRAS
jgi:hypothetical protein